MIIGYARVSTDDQRLDAQTDALQVAGAERIFSDKISGSIRKRPEFDKRFEQLRPGDVVVVTKYDRLARSLRALLDIKEALKDQGAGFRSLADDIDTTTPVGRLVFHVLPPSPSLSASASQIARGRDYKHGLVGLSPLALAKPQKEEAQRMRGDEHRL